VQSADVHFFVADDVAAGLEPVAPPDHEEQWQRNARRGKAIEIYLATDKRFITRATACPEGCPIA
jgi:hypothetical protein